MTTLNIDRKVVFWIGALIAGLAFLFVFSPILLPFVAGMGLAYLLDPLADWFERRGMTRLWATLTILVLFVIVFVAFLIVVVPVLVIQAGRLIDSLPTYLERLDGVVDSILSSGWARRLGVDPEAVRSSVSGMFSQGATLATTLMASLLSGGLAFINVVALVVVTPVVAFYLLYDWDRMIKRVDDLLPRDHVAEIRRLALEMDKVIAGYVRGQIIVGTILGVFYAAGLVILGVNFGFLIGLSAGLISFIPYLGTFVGFVASVGVALVQFWPDWIWIVATMVLFVVGQVIEGNFLQPIFIGNNVGLHPVWVMFALFAFGLLFGFVGLLIAIPAAAAAGVLVRYATQRYLASPIYSGEGGRSKTKKG